MSTITPGGSVPEGRPDEQLHTCKESGGRWWEAVLDSITPAFYVESWAPWVRITLTIFLLGALVLLYRLVTGL